MAPYLIFLSLALVVAIVFVALRLSKVPLRFESMFIPLATVLFFVPFVCLTFLMWIVISTGLLLVSAKVLSAFGLIDLSGFPASRIMRVWDGILLAWILLAGAFYLARFRGDLFRLFSRHGDVAPSPLLSEGRPHASNTSDSPTAPGAKERD
jgi:hypothetical protein